jgi:hypothetical protein
MPERRRRYDPDERFPLDADPEDVLRGLLDAEEPSLGEDDRGKSDAYRRKARRNGLS